MDIYAQNILDRYKTPFYREKKLDADIQHKEANHSCGDSVSVSAKFEDGKLSGYSFEGSGCAISMSTADMLGDLTEGMTEDEILKLGKDEIYEMLGVDISIRRSKCALLALMTLQNAIRLKNKEEKIDWTVYHL